MTGGMTEAGWVSLIALAGWLVLALGAYRAHRIDAAKTLKMALTWAAIFVAIAIVFGMLL